jgi:transcriptional regulator with GAF, ATPase, and Fis domain
LQESQVSPVGSSKVYEVDVRFVCATNRDLEAEVAAGKFREDLFYRINVLPIEMPPLRRRREDLPELVEHFVAKHAPRVNATARSFDADALAELATHEWPGNVRELENVVERVLVHHGHEPLIRAGHLGAAIPRKKEPNGLALGEFEGLPLEEATNRLERHLIQRALERSDHVQSRAADLLGTTRRILKYKMDQLGVGATEESAQTH